MNELSWSAESASGYLSIVVDVMIPFGSITWEAICVGCDSAIVAIWGAPWSLVLVGHYFVWHIQVLSEVYS